MYENLIVYEPKERWQDREGDKKGGREGERRRKGERRRGKEGEGEGGKEGEGGRERERERDREREREGDRDGERLGRERERGRAISQRKRKYSKEIEHGKYEYMLNTHYGMKDFCGQIITKRITQRDKQIDI